jgi:ubiquitin-conjugating enzyme E2 N
LALRKKKKNVQPTRPPIVRFLTRIYHPSVDDEGKLGLRVLGPGLWRKEFTIRQILLDIKLLLLDPGTGRPHSSFSHHFICLTPPVTCGRQVAIPW